MKKQVRELLSMLAALIVVLSTILAPVSVSAAEAIDMAKSGKATLTMQLPAVSDSVKVYQIADYDGESKITMKKEAADLKVTLDGKEKADALSEKAKTLAAKISGKPIVGKTDAAGKVKFEKLKLGYYLVVVDKCGSDSVKYQIAPTIVSVPARESSPYKYDVSVKLAGQTVTPAVTTPKAPTDSSVKETTVGAGTDSSVASSNTDDSSGASVEENATGTPTQAAQETTGTPTQAAQETTETPTQAAQETPTQAAQETTGTPTQAAQETTGTPTQAAQEATVTPTSGDITTPEIPVGPTGKATVTPTPGDESGIADITPTPGDESGITDITPTPGDESGITDITPTPGDESGIADITPTPGDDSSIADPTVTPDPNKWQLSVTKYWVDKNRIELPEEDITVDVLPIQIWKKAEGAESWEKVELVDLTAKDKWTYSWEADDDGTQWTVSEPTTPIGYTCLTIKQSRNAEKKTLAFKVTNESNADVTPAPRQLSIIKYWKDKNGEAIKEEDIGVEKLPVSIYRRDAAEGSSWVLYDKIELTAEKDWEYSWGAADDKADWTVTEKDVPEGYTLVEPITLAHNTEWTKIQFRITNKSDKGEDVTVTVPPTSKPVTVTPTIPVGKKQINIAMYWKDTDGSKDLDASKVTPDSVAVKVYKKPENGKWDVYKELTLTKKDDWKTSLTVDDDGSAWTVTETEPSGFEKVSIMQSTADDGKRVTFKITNKKSSSAAPTAVPAGTISYSVTKTWLNTSGQALSSSQIGVSSLTVKIYRKGQGETSYSEVETVELLPSKNWTYSWTAPDDGSTWTVTETVPNGYTKKSITQASNATRNTKVFTITNQKSSSSSITSKVTGAANKATTTPKSTVAANNRTTPRTGDTQNMMIPLATFIAAAIIMVYLARKRVR